MRRAVHRRVARNRRIAVALTALCAAVAAVAVQLGATPGHGLGVGAGHATAVTDRPGSASLVGTAGTFPTASTVLSLAEPAVTAGAAERSLPTTVWYPATPPTSSSPSGHGGPFPLVVFSEGYDIALSSYAPLLRAVASAGIVVAAPVFPHTDAAARSLDEADIVNHPADLRFVIGAVLGLAARPGSVLSGLVDPSEVGLLGHSDGGDVSVAVAANSCCQDARVKALAVLSGAELTSFGGHYFSGPTVPLLAVQGSADTVNPPACSVQIYDAAGSPKFYLDLLGAQHEPPYLDAGTDRDIVVRVVVDFFAATLAGEQARATELAADGTVQGTSVLVAGGAAPPAPGDCPGAPA